MRAVNGLKCCSACHETKPVSEYYKGKAWKDGLYPYCIPCEKIKAKAKHKKFAADRVARAQKWAEENRERRRVIANRWQRNNPEARADLANRRRARRMANGVVPYKRQDIFVRDSGVCGICGDSIDAALKRPDPLSFSIDHILPISLGGADCAENVQAAHLACNVKKGNRIGEVV